MSNYASVSPEQVETFEKGFKELCEKIGIQACFVLVKYTTADRGLC